MSWAEIRGGTRRMNRMRQANILYLCLRLFALLGAHSVQADDPYRYFNWKVSYGTISPLGVPQRGILINGLFPGPTLDCVTNDNLIVNVENDLDEPFLITWNGIQLRKNSWQDGVLGTNCPIPPHSNWTYKFQPKDQIGTYMYFASTLMHRAAGAFGALNVQQRSVIPVPYPLPVEEFTLLIGDWYNTDYKVLEQKLDQGIPLPFPDGLLINGLPKNGAIFTGEQGLLYKFRVTNVGISTSINFRIQGHTMTLVEVEGTHTLQESYESIDVHVGQSVAVLVTLNTVSKDYYIVASTRFTKPVLTTTAILHYAGSNTPPSPALPSGPTYQIHWSMKQARTIRTNLTANAARPNPQGSYHYGTIPISETYILANAPAKIDGKLRYAVNSISYVDPSTPLKLADWQNIPGVFTLGFPDKPTNATPMEGTNALGTTLHDFLEIVFYNTEGTVQYWHLDGYSFYVVAYGPRRYGEWTIDMRKRYNMVDAITRHTVQVYPYSWTAVLVSLDNKGMWNLRSSMWARRYLGQQLYVRVWSEQQSLLTEFDMPPDELFCGLAKQP